MEKVENLKKIVKEFDFEQLKFLTSWERRRLLWWSIFSQRRFVIFIKMCETGKYIRSSYLDTKSIKRKNLDSQLTSYCELNNNPLMN